ncbi:hypothetical protein QVD17_06869 [Tagetes erecta]|uniref:Reverse transcriptase zinc-binding domain-containing protein n=1 Tax=Tagetes erecta TaxID=13708 RepID=A0AAD8PBM9_TARER|nr:hypothetical protein QVD17_06869 [Tagetes erecta]
MQQLQQLFLLIQGTTPSQNFSKWIWTASNDGQFSVNSLRNMLELNRAPIDLNPMLWSSWVPLKIRCFMWKARLNKIPSKNALMIRGVSIGMEECSLCFGEQETTDHILLHCRFTEKIWAEIFNWCKWPVVANGSIRERFDDFINVWSEQFEGDSGGY